MSVDDAFRKMIRLEIEGRLRPIQAAVAQLQAEVSASAGVRDLVKRLAPLGNLFGGATTGVAAKKRGPGRPPGVAKKPGRPAKKVAAPAKKKGKKAAAATGAKAACALIGCKRPSRKKGYCGAHYQKYRMLIRTNRLPADWVEYAAANSVADVVLPRGRAAAKAREAREG